MVLAHFDPDALDWFSASGPAPIPLTAAVTLDASGTVLGVGIGPEDQLCDTEIAWMDDGSWTAPHCRDEIKVFQHEVPVAPPRAVVLPNGDVVVVYHEDHVTIAATTLHAGVWSTPERVTLMEQSLDLAVTATPAGDVIVGLGTLGVSALRYVPGVGWGELVPIETFSELAWGISAAPGICGDDAWIAYVTDEHWGEIRVARVRGGAAEASTVGASAEESLRHLSITTRP